MVHGIGAIPGIIVIVIIICIMNNYCCISIPPVITPVVIIIIVMINTDRHYGKWYKIGRIIGIIIRRVIRYIYRGIYILNNRRLFNHHDGLCCRCGGGGCCRSNGSGRFSTGITRKPSAKVTKLFTDGNPLQLSVFASDFLFRSHHRQNNQRPCRK
jgi:hypothetical protein